MDTCSFIPESNVFIKNKSGVLFSKEVGQSGSLGGTSSLWQSGWQAV